MGGREQGGCRDWDTVHSGDGGNFYGSNGKSASLRDGSGRPHLLRDGSGRLHLNRWMIWFVGDGVDKLAGAVATASGTHARVS